MRKKRYAGLALLGLGLLALPALTVASPTQPVFSQSMAATPKTEDFPSSEPSWPRSFESVSFSALVATPSLNETPYDRTLQGFGNFFLFSVPLFKLENNLFIHGELGPGFSFSKIVQEGSDKKQRHLYITVPARFRAIYSLSRKLHLECFLGIVLRPVEYFSGSNRRTEIFKSPQSLMADGGFGVDYHINPALKSRFLLGYSFFSAGLELTW